MDTEVVKIRRIIGPTRSGAAVLLGNEKKTFVVFVGFYEAAALIREVNHEVPARPLTHELVQAIFLGLDVDVKSVIISSIIENTFCATLVLEQKIEDTNGSDSGGGAGTGSGATTGRRKEIRIDARPSDCLVLAVKNHVDIQVTSEVFDQVQDVSNMTDDLEGNLAGMAMGDLEIDVRGGSTLDEMEFPPGLDSTGDVPEEEEGDDDDDDNDDDDVKENR